VTRATRSGIGAPPSYISSCAAPMVREC